MEWKVLLVYCSPRVSWAVVKECVKINGAATEWAVWVFGEQGAWQEFRFCMHACFLGGEMPHQNHWALRPGTPQLAQPEGQGC